jgi:hypothetical protein
MSKPLGQKIDPASKTLLEKAVQAPELRRHARHRVHPVEERWSRGE